MPQFTEPAPQPLKKAVRLMKETPRKAPLPAKAAQAEEDVAPPPPATAEADVAEEEEAEPVMHAPPPTSANEGMAVVVRFSLPSGCYATSLLREFCVTVRGV
eukprot:TRINITY_DN12997_c0_g1_i2.p1 TRINITY_DN12997_c0_g1~~TRINITY_DN12997_c0_g1_i2.p1  ORF type:complete len:102 (+),score=26.34 TRINITY_DN12997_c0_g1_i2:56-361(+)